MVQQPRHDAPVYSCTIPITQVTGNPDEEAIAFGTSPEDARHQAEQVLMSTYGCDNEIVHQLMQQAIVEQMAPWCAPNSTDASN